MRRYADSSILALTGWGAFALGLLCWLAGWFFLLSYLLLYWFVFGAAIVGMIFAITDLRTPEFRRQALLAVFGCGLLFATNYLLTQYVVLR
jgi:hypothetical protein